MRSGVPKQSSFVPIWGLLAAPLPGNVTTDDLPGLIRISTVDAATGLAHFCICYKLKLWYHKNGDDRLRWAYRAPTVVYFRPAFILRRPGYRGCRIISLYEQCTNTRKLRFFHRHRHVHLNTIFNVRSSMLSLLVTCDPTWIPGGQ
jgi:hypothetical protein